MLDQIMILVTGATAVFLTQSRLESRRRWACIIGMLGQPFWLHATWGEWGMFGVSLLYTWAWAKGVWVFWLRPTKQNTQVPTGQDSRTESGSWILTDCDFYSSRPFVAKGRDVSVISCPHDPKKTTGPIGMYHCPECGAMVLAGCDHPSDEVARFQGVVPYGDGEGTGTAL